MYRLIKLAGRLAFADDFFDAGAVFIAQFHFKAKCFVTSIELARKLHFPWLAVGRSRVCFGVMLPEGDGQIFRLTNEVPVGGWAEDNINGMQKIAGLLPKLQLCSHKTNPI